MDISPRNTCRVCNSAKLVPILALGPQYVSNFVDAGEEGVKIPLDLVLCDPTSGGCGLLQLTTTTPPEIMYRQYWYRSGMNQTMTDALADIAHKAEKLVDIEKGDIAIDIGANDGTLLRQYISKELFKVGFEPAKNLVPDAMKGNDKIINDFFNAASFKSELGEKKAKIITSIAMFYDLEEPDKFVADIASLLEKDGVWIIQMSYLPLMLEQNAFDNICHEHLEYYSLQSLNFLLKRHGLEVFDAELNDVNGGSFRVYVRHEEGTIAHIPDDAAQNVKKLEDSEKQLGLGTMKPYLDFAQRVEKRKKDVVGFIRKEVGAGKKIYVYGASTKGNTLLQYFSLDNTLIKAAAERNKDKWGRKTVGTLIPIISEEQARQEKPDYFLILPWHFLKEFRQREAEFFKQGGKFIVPLPEFEILTS
ncbi:MAG: class I SAM-dependent methyltransferase [Candidatus Micrarchaeota archaeon]